MAIEIKSADDKDFDQIYALIKEFSVFIKTPEKVSTTLDQMVRDKELFKCLIALEGEKIIGYAFYFFGYFSWTGKSLYLDDLYVTEKYRGKNIGSKLLNAIIEIARKENCTKVRWQVSDWNRNAIEFYKKHGAKIDTIERNCDLKL